MFDKFIKKIFGTNDNQINSNGLPVVTSNPPMPKVKKLREPKTKVDKTTLSPKEIATKKKIPWVDVVGFNINNDNIRNGFFELDWNEYWIEKLKQEGYGFDGDPDEEIVDRWFRNLAHDISLSEGISDKVSAGYLIMPKNLTKG